MASIYRHSSREGWYVQVCVPIIGRCSLWLGDVPKAGANEVARHIERLAVAAAANTTAHADALRWARNTDKRIRERLMQWGLIPEASTNTYTITTWVDHYITERSDVKPRTILKYKASRAHLLKHIADKDIRTVTVADAKRFARNLTGKESSSGSYIKTIKQIFAAAVDARLIDANPFESLTASAVIDPKRSAYITPEVVDLIYKKCPSPESKIAFALARWGGLRIPSEILTLKITDVDWETNRILITSPKGERYVHRATRTIPLFPQLIQPLTDHIELLPTGETYILHRYRQSANKELRKHLLAAIKAEKLQPWPKLWMNLRASCRTDLEEQFPTHVCDDWLGHSNAVASKHYKRVTPDHFAKAVGTVTRTVNKSH